MRRVFLVLGAAVVCLAQSTPDIRVDVNLVRVAVSATDRSGRIVQDMRQDEFTLLDNGKPRPIEYMWREADLPLTVGLIVDVSGSQLRYFAQHREFMTQFLRQVLQPQDRAFIATVAGNVGVIVDLTNSLEKLQTGLDNLNRRRGIELGEPCIPTEPFFVGQSRRWGCGGGSVLWHGMYTAAKLKMKPVDGRKAMILVTDGWDTGSIHNLTDAIEAAQGADTLVYAIRYPPSSRLLVPKTRRDLGRLSEETGGRAYTAPKEGPGEIFTQIEGELRNLYVLGFAVPETTRDGKVHALEVRSKRKGVTLRARKSYSANP